MSARGKAPRLRFLHLHSTFDPGGKELRAVRLMNAFGAGIEHSIVSAVPGALGASAFVGKGVRFGVRPDFPALTGVPLPGRLRDLARAMAGYDLILTYNFGAMDAVMAHTVFGAMMDLPPLVHHEDGFNEDEIRRRSGKRNWYRRVALGRASALVVCSESLERIALAEWHQPRGRVTRIANGIATAAYGARPRLDALPRIVKRPGEFWLGTLAGLRPVKNLPRLVRAFAQLPQKLPQTQPEAWHLVILGQGNEAAAIREEAQRLGVGARVHLPGHVAEPAKVMGLFDLFALSSDSEQFPVSVIEAMAAGLPVVSTDVGDVRSMLAEANRPFLAPPQDEGALAGALAALAGDPGLRSRLGAANRARARAEFDEKRMIAAYRGVYAGAMGRDFP